MWWMIIVEIIKAAVEATGRFMQSQGEASALKRQSDMALASGYSEEQRYRDDAAKKIATQMATMANRGLDVSTASPLALQAESAKNAELDALTIRTGAQNKSNALKAQASATLAAGWFNLATGSGSDLSSLGNIGSFGSSSGGGSAGGAGLSGSGGMTHNMGPGGV